MTKIYTENEWAPLHSVVVGTADYANWPISDNTFFESMQNSAWTETNLNFGPIDQEIVDRANLSLDNFALVLKDLGVEVFRPLPRNYQALDQFYGYCPRDTVLIVGNKVIATPTPYQSRRFEWETMLHVWNGHPLYTVDNPEAEFDAANVCRLGQDLLYLVSPSGNRAGGLWLQDFLGKEYRVHILENVYSGVHIDSTITPIREGLVALNASRINEDNMPAPLRNWDKIWITAEDLVEQSFVHYPYASNWIGLNFLMINEQLAIVDPKQEKLRQKLLAHGVDSIGVDLTESRTLGGGHHCVTLDINRG